MLSRVAGQSAATLPAGFKGAWRLKPTSICWSFRGADHLHRILEEAQTIVSEALAKPPQAKSPSNAKVKEKP